VINPNNYYTVQGWMLSELGLKGNALAVYAIIYGFSQDGVSEYAGSSRYLCEWLGCSKKTVLTTLASLTERGLLTKKTINQNGVNLCNYVAVRRPYKEPAEGGVKITPPGENLPQGGEEITPGRCKNYTGGGEEITPHIDIDNNSDIHRDIYKGSAPAAPQLPAGKKKKANGEKPPKHEYGEYKHVKLTDDEYAKLVKKHGEQKTAALIKYLDEYIEERPRYKSESHYLAIGRWVVDAVNEKARRSGQANQTRPAGRGGHPGTMGPNGIVIDPTKNDLDGIF
jgi:hypothetical protein